MLFPIIVTSQVGGATKKKKKRHSQNSNILLPSLSTPFPPSFWVSPILCEEVKAPVVTAQSAEVAGCWTMPQPKPRDSWVHWEERVLAEVGPQQEKHTHTDTPKRFVLVSWRTKGAIEGGRTSEDWDKDRLRQRWVLTTVVQWGNTTVRTWKYNCGDTHTYYGWQQGKQCQGFCLYLLYSKVCLMECVYASMSVCVCLSCDRLEG